MPRVIHHRDNKIAAIFQRRCHIAVERGKPALMLADLRPIHPEDRLVIRRANAQKRPCMRLRRKVEVLLVPHQPLVPEKLRLLRIPVPRHLQRRRLGEVVVHRSRVARLCLFIHKPSALELMLVKVVKTRLIGVWNHMPVSVQRLRRTQIGSSDHNWRSRGGLPDRSRAKRARTTHQNNNDPQRKQLHRQPQRLQMTSRPILSGAAANAVGTPSLATANETGPFPKERPRRLLYLTNSTMPGVTRPDTRHAHKSQAARHTPDTTPDGLDRHR